MGRIEAASNAANTGFVGFKYRKTNCFALSAAGGALVAFDLGWPCSLYEYQRELKAAGLRWQDLSAALISHMHMDHAGLLGEFVRLGIPCWVTPDQLERVAAMERIIVRNPEYRTYTPIELARLTPVSVGGLNDLLAAHGVSARVFATPGHSDDSLSVLCARGHALIGDLSPLDQVMPDDTVTLASYQLLRDHGARRAHPSHATEFDLDLRSD